MLSLTYIYIYNKIQLAIVIIFADISKSKVEQSLYVQWKLFKI